MTKPSKKQRLSVYLDPDVMKALAVYAARRDQSRSLIAEAAIASGVSNIVLETDAPYLAPVPHRGKRNEASFLTYVIDRLSAVLTLSPEDVAERTSENARRLFNL